MEHPPRDRVTIDLRGLREQLQTQALRRQMTPAALVRQALLAYLAPTPSNQTPEVQKRPLMRDKQLIKVTLRLPSGHVELMNLLARRADVSQSIYVATLIEGSPPPTNHTQTVAALQASTNRLAVINTDLRDFLRVMYAAKPGVQQELERYRAGIKTLNQDIRHHLNTAAKLVAELRATRRSK
ncbi:hypothetical protein [Hydrogenophaga sp.]|uniref:hypothetical protein n=1 Tax=Hydrogenophaga sp. TaxID=1904254 RepID=UPI00286E6C6C|nr:hypothetical protein [Hydrogenophaga sp.]